MTSKKQATYHMRLTRTAVTSYATIGNRKPLYFAVGTEGENCRTG